MCPETGRCFSKSRKCIYLVEFSVVFSKHIACLDSYLKQCILLAQNINILLSFGLASDSKSLVSVRLLGKITAACYLVICHFTELFPVIILIK